MTQLYGGVQRPIETQKSKSKRKPPLHNYFVELSFLLLRRFFRLENVSENRHNNL